MQNKLLPCPFCGGEAHPCMDKYHKYFVGCIECGFYYGIKIEDGVELKDGWVAIHNTKEEAIASWNTRKPMERIVYRLKDEIRPIGLLKLLEPSWETREERVSRHEGYCKGIENAIEIVKRWCR